MAASPSWRTSWRRLWRSSTWAISWASTPASSSGDSAASRRPVWTATTPPGAAKAFTSGSSSTWKRKAKGASGASASSRAPRVSTASRGRPATVRPPAASSDSSCSPRASSTAVGRRATMRSRKGSGCRSRAPIRATGVARTSAKRVSSTRFRRARRRLSARWLPSASASAAGRERSSTDRARASSTVTEASPPSSRQTKWTAPPRQPPGARVSRAAGTAVWTPAPSRTSAPRAGSQRSTTAAEAAPARW